jgi:diaminopimelate decarboxylase
MIRDALARYAKAFAAFPHMVCYAVKANSNIAILKEIAACGAGADIVSGGELFRAVKAGIDPRKIVYAGVGKTDEEIAAGLRNAICMFNVESWEELQRINAIAGRMRVTAPISFRINPDIDAQTHRHITTGKRENKFGIHFPHILEHYIAASKLPHIALVGIHAHIGSQLLVSLPYITAVKKLIEVINALELLGIRLRYLDIGGGIGIRYHQERPITPAALSRAVAPFLKGKDITLILEPGRSIVGEAGMLAAKVLYHKYTGQKHFIVVDAAMNDLMRPVLYDAYHEILPIDRYRGREQIIADIVGPICETSDCLARGRKIVMPAAGDILGIACAGAYGFSMSSQYNSRPRAAEVLVLGREYKLIRKREQYADLIRGETR